MARSGDGLKMCNGIWYTSISINGTRIERSAHTRDRKEAERIRDLRRAEQWRVVVAGEAPRVTFAHATVEYIKDREGRLKDMETVRDRLRWLCGKMGSVLISHLDSATICHVLAQRRKEGVTRQIKLRNGDIKPVKVSSTVSDATLDRYAAAIGAVLNHAFKLGLLRTPPPKVERFQKVKRGVPRFLTRDQVDRLLAHLPEHTLAMVRFALATGLRRANVTGMRWCHIDLDHRKAWIPGAEAKAGYDIPVPLSDEAMDVLNEQLGKHETWVFPFRSKSVHRVTGKAWREALVAADLPITTRFHDLRHTWASAHAVAGTPMKVLQTLGGWRTSTMVDRYAGLSQEALAAFANNGELVRLGPSAPNSRHKAVAS